VVLPERAVELNPSGAEILALCDGRRIALDVADAMRSRHRDSGCVWDETHEFLQNMNRIGVVQAMPNRS